MQQRIRLISCLGSATLLLLATILCGLPSVTSFTIEDLEDTVEAISNIIGGEIAPPGSTPWLVSLKDVQYSHPVHFCAGSIINKHWILTAAHCIIGYDNPMHSVQVVVGDYDLSVFDMFWEETKQISHVFIHPSFDYYSRNYNVAMIKVSSQIHFNKRVRPLPLPPVHHDHHPIKEEVNQSLDPNTIRKKKNHDPMGKQATGVNSDESWNDNYYDDIPHSCSERARPKPDSLNDNMGYIAGWGSAQLSNMMNLIHEAHVPIIWNQICHSIYPELFTDAMICAGNLTYGGVDPCSGDWGGPLVDSHGFLRGVASWSIGCGRPGFPAVYVDINAVHDWICDILDDH